ncbi:hypothetical protein ACQY0O_008306 [Thecaphora frezii]|nr:putative exo-1,3-beta-glucanase [Thecaphora frezii]
MRLSSLSLGLVALALTATDADALPAIKQYRGVSRYAGLYVPETEVPKLPNPRSVLGTRSMRLGSNSLDTDSYLDELHYVDAHGADASAAAFWDKVKGRLDSALDRLDRITEALGVSGGASPSIRKASRLVQGAAESLGLSFTVQINGNGNGNHGGTGSWQHEFEVATGANASEPLRWGSEAELAACLRNGHSSKECESHTSALPNLPEDSGFDYNTQKVRGVNIGNWLLFEGWMSSKLMRALNNHAINAPSANPIVDEWTAGLYSDYNWAAYVLQKHFDEWMTEADWKAIAAAGLNHVRIPVPYFMFAEAKGPNVPYLTLNRFAKLKEGVQLAKKYGLKVWIDLHSVPGSQNGYDNSGHAGSINWANNPSYYTQTQYAFNRLVTEFTQGDYRGTVTAIEAVNEPHGAQNAKVQELLNTYYPWARNKVAKPDGWTDYSTMLLAAHDAFQGLQYWQNFWTGRARHRVLLDTHPYFVYSDAQKAKKDKARLQEVCDLQASFVQSQKYYPSIAGEFGVNGPNGDRAQDRDLPVGPVKFPQGPAYPYSVKYMAFMARNFRTQQYIYEKGAGWIMWSWRNDEALDWSYQAGLQWGWIPKDLDAKPYGNNPCNLSALEAATEEDWQRYEDESDFY